MSQFRMALRRRVSAITYLLRANFGGANYTFADTNDVETNSPGSVQDGALAVRETGTGTVKVASNKFEIVGDSNWGTTNLKYTTAITRAAGRMLKAKVTTPSSAQFGIIAFNGDSVGSDGASRDLLDFIFFHSSGSVLVGHNNPSTASARVTVATVAYSNSTEYEVAIIQGGYTSAGVPDSTAAYGAFFFIKGGAFSNWTLMWAGDVGDGRYNSNGYVMARVFSGAFLYDDIKVPTSVLTSPLVPANIDTSVATTDTFTHHADHFAELKITTLPSSGNLDVVFRQQDSSNKWIHRISSAGAYSLVEVVANVETTRAGPTAASSFADGSLLRWNAHTSSIRAWSVLTSTPVLRADYASATNFNTETDGSITFGTGAIAHMANWNLGTSGEYAALDNY